MSSSIDRIEDIVAGKFDGFSSMTAKVTSLVGRSAPDHHAAEEALTAQLASTDGETCLKLGVLALALGRFDDAVTVLRNAPEGSDKRWMLGVALKAKQDYAGAVADFERAGSRGFDEVTVLAEMTECQRLSGDEKTARETLKRLEAKAGSSAAYFTQAAAMAEVDGQVEKAMGLLDKAIVADEGYVPALFRLAFLEDLRGDEDRAIQLYEKCVKDQVHVNALINLAVLREDRGEFERALGALNRVLAVFPNHPRAKLFSKDVRSSMTMFYDEDFEKRRDKFQQVLEMPISDFELSVRSRNCLKKMGIRTLGDLTRISESELLSYKNFGETSLNEIKAILASKNLRLGQALEDQAKKTAAAMLPGAGVDVILGGGVDDAAPSAEPSVTGKLIDDLEFSVRSRKCLQKLNVRTVADLLVYSEAQLMAVKNFGSISLKEVKDRLTELGLSLRKND